jgi:peptidoglycan/LPS O-acetylase OafA/YrhL
LSGGVQIMHLAAIGTADSGVVQYRADIDGLRAVAVLSVIAYHLFESALPGGYLGVDIFFVISGYLITLVIWREIQLGRHSIRQFYNRRIRRILPALLVQLAVSALVAAVFLLPATLVSFAKSLIATLAFVGNVYFWQDARDYFAQAAESKPLLHMWSLGVEEQFYIAYPLILTLLARWWLRGALAIIALLSVGSIALNVLLLTEGLATTAFYALPTRAWQLGMGAVVALLPGQAALPTPMARATSWVGAILVVGSIVSPPEYVSTMPSGLPAAIGVALLIIAGQNGGATVQRVLRLRPIVFVGLISYSLYLWHWPIIVFAKNYLVRELTFFEVLASLALMIGCATLSWRFVERPFRSKNMPIRTVIGSMVLAIAVLTAIAIVLIRSGGLPGRLNPQAEVIAEAVDSNHRCSLRDILVVGRSTACVITLPSRNPADADVVVIGDSVGKMYTPVFQTIFVERGLTGLMIWTNGCLPTVRVNLSQDCIRSARSNLDEAKRLTRARTVVVGLQWSSAAEGLVDEGGGSIDNDQDSALLEAMDDLIEQLQRAGKGVVLIGPSAEPGYEFASITSRELAFRGRIDSVTYISTEEFTRRFGRIIEHFEPRNDIGFARPDRIQCAAGRCNYLLQGRSLFADDIHFSVAEVYRFRRELELALLAVQPD